MTDQDLTAPEAVERVARLLERGRGDVSATLRALSADLQAEKARAEALDAKLREAVEVLRLLLQVQDGLPMTGMEATQRSNNARAYLASLEGDKP